MPTGRVHSHRPLHRRAVHGLPLQAHGAWLSYHPRRVPLPRPEDSQRTKAIKALDLAAKDFPILNTKFLALSATIAEKVSDGQVITCIAGIKYQGTTIDWDNFNISFAKQLTNDPAQPSKESVKRLFAAWSEIVFEPPYIKWPCKAVNLIKFYEFRNDIDRAFVEAAVDRYIERISQLGRDTPSDLAMQRIALLQLRKSIEPCRSELMVDDMVADVRAGNTAPAAPDSRARLSGRYSIFKTLMVCLGHKSP